MNRKHFLLLSIFFAFFVFVSCEKDETEPKINEAEVLATYLESAESPLGKDYVNSDMAAIVSAEQVKTWMATNSVYVIDIRSSADFALGHIPGAVNVTLANILTHVQGLNQASYEKIVIACYTGQTACFATTLLQLKGYSKVASMKFGMASWHADFASVWNNARANTYATMFETTANPKPEKGELPVLSTGKKTGSEIFEVRWNEVLTAGFSPLTITAATVFANPSNYYIVNYWPENIYLNPGHIPGAKQYTPKSTIKLEVDLKTLPTDKTIVVYCYTGQGSAALVPYLKMLGYDAKTLTFGTNAMIYDVMISQSVPSAWKTSEIKGYTYSTGARK